jgi:hypothetical protein
MPDAWRMKRRSECKQRPNGHLRDMQSKLTKISFVVFLTTMLFCGCFGANALIGVWRSDTRHFNTSEYYSTVEFRTNGHCRKIVIVKKPDGKTVTLPQIGTYEITDSNHVNLELFADVPQPLGSSTFRLTYGVSNNILYLQSFDETKKVDAYQRIKN